MNYSAPSAQRRVSPRLSGFLTLVLVVLSMCACSPDRPALAAANRAVKLQPVQESMGSEVELLGTVRQRQQADLAFESAGRLVELAVDLGDTVKAGQVMASLDRQPARLRVQRAQASVEGAKAQALEREANYQRQQRLYVAGNIAQSVVESAGSSRQQAAAELSRGEAELALAQRELDRSQLIAPFNGRVVARHADRYAQVAPGQVVLQVQSSADAQVLAAVPIAQAQRLQPGDSAVAYSTSAPNTAIALVLEGISPRADNGLVQTCLFRLRDASALPWSGENVRVTLNLPTARRLSVPVQALSIGASSTEASVFVYLASSGQVSLRSVKVTDIAQGRAYIGSGLALGEQVVTAGVAFLVDGQTVSVFKASTRLAETPL